MNIVMIGMPTDEVPEAANTAAALAIIPYIYTRIKTESFITADLKSMDAAEFFDKLTQSAQATKLACKVDLFVAGTNTAEGIFSNTDGKIHVIIIVA